MKPTPVISALQTPKAGEQQHLGNLIGSSLALAIGDIANRHNGPVLLITPDSQNARRLEREISQFTPEKCEVFPDWETLPYDNFSPHQDIISERLSLLYQMPQLVSGVVIMPVNTLLQRVLPKSFLTRHALVVKKGDLLSLEKLRDQLESAGYRHVDQVMEHGEYASRGSILDLFPMGSHQPLRIDFFDDEIDTIREFDPETQRSTTEIDSISLLPAREFPTDADAIEQFRVRWREQFDARREPESVYQQVSKRTLPAGIEYWQPLFFDEMETLFDYLPDNTLVISVGDLEQAGKQFLADADNRYDQRRVDPMRPLLSPKSLWLDTDEMFSRLKPIPRIMLTDAEVEGKSWRINIRCRALPDLNVNHQLKEPMGALRQFCEQFSGKVVFSVESEGRREALLDMLSRIKLRPQVCHSVYEALDAPSRVTLIIGPAENGFILEDAGFASFVKPTSSANALRSVAVAMIKKPPSAVKPSSGLWQSSSPVSRLSTSSTASDDMKGCKPSKPAA